MSSMSSTAIASYSTPKSYPFNPVFFLLSTGKPSETLPRYNGVATISECFALNLWISVPLTNNYFFYYI